MTGYEEKVYEKADDAQYMMAELERHLHGIRYDPSAATAADIKGSYGDPGVHWESGTAGCKTGIRPNAWIGRIPSDFGASSEALF